MLLRTEGEACADRLAAAGVPVRKRCHEGVAQGFLGEPPGSPEVDAAIGEIAAWIGEMRKAVSR
jgi:acetyl esterase/lipase